MGYQFPRVLIPMHVVIRVVIRDTGSYNPAIVTFYIWYYEADEASLRIGQGLHNTAIRPEKIVKRPGLSPNCNSQKGDGNESTLLSTTS